MRSVNDLFRRFTAAVLMLLLTGAAMAQERGASQEPQNASSGPAVTSQSTQAALPDNPEPAGAQASGQQSQPAATPQTGAAQQPDQSPKPVGTAAAPYERTMGIAASRPAGAAIAPAKQRRVRTIVISLAVIAGAGIAVGSVAALSHGSPSRP